MRRAAAVLLLAACSSTPGTRNDGTADRVFAAIKPVLEAQVARTGALPVAHVDHVPADACCDDPGHACKVAELDGLPWIDPELLPATLRYQLSYDSDGTTVTVHAMGDLDCDRITTDTELSGAVTGKTVVWTVTKNAVDD